ncbi:MAG: MBL fold metallo-hydrolase [Gemmatimonadaceae bacterium]
MIRAIAVPPSPPSAHHTARGFRNPWPAAEPSGFLSFLRWIGSRFFLRQLAPPDRASFARVTSEVAHPRADAGELRVTWVGHSTALIQVGGLNILTDPMWSERASPLRLVGPRRWVEPGIPFDALPPLDLVLLSHNHYDHLDEPTVRRLAERDPEADWVAPLGLGAWLTKRGVPRVTELDWWGEASLRGARVACTPAQHFSARGVHDRMRTLWCGFVVTVPAPVPAGDRRVYYAGDSAYHPEFGAIGERYGPFDLSLVPIGAYEPRWFMRPVHMDPDDAVRVFLDVTGGSAHGAHSARGGQSMVAGEASEARDARPAHAESIARGGPPTGKLSGAERRSVIVPVHWGTFKLTDEPMDEPPRRARAAWERAALPASDLWLLAHGETRRLG